MFFEIVPEHRHDTSGSIRKRWIYRKGTPDNPGDDVCRSASIYPDEASCRQNIAAARKSFGGAKFAKVVSG